MPISAYIGRFAPTPSGPLHFGSLVAALGSYLDAAAHHGQWLVRTEDTDHSRCKAEFAAAQLKMLDLHGLHHDKTVRRQSLHSEDYLHTLQKLSPHLYPCNCSRKKYRQSARIGALGTVYPGFCRQRQLSCLNPPDAAIRLRLPAQTLTFTDRIAGNCCYNLQQDIGDPVLRRRDGDFAYALAVVTDDALQQITHVVRGADLLAATAIHCYLQEILQLPTPQYLHLPLVLNPDGSKYSKQNHAPALNPLTPGKNLLAALNFLGQDTGDFHIGMTAEEILAEAVNRWDIEAIPRK